MKNKLYGLEEDLKIRLNDASFRKEWEKSEEDYQLGRILIQKRMKLKISQRQLAKKAHTTQAVISRIESMNSNPSVDLLRRIAQALGAKLRIEFQ